MKPETIGVKRSIESRLIWFFLVVFTSLLLAGWLYQVYQRPYTSIGVCVLVVGLLWYTASDDATSGSSAESMVHRKGEFEVVFWVVFALFAGVVFFMFPDSPILTLIHHVKTRILSWTQDAVSAAAVVDTRALPVPASLALVGLITLSTLHFTRVRQREELIHKPDVFTRKLSANLLSTSSEERVMSVKEAVGIVDSCLRELDHEFLPSSLSRFIRYSKDLLNEAKIIRVFREAGGSLESPNQSEDEDDDDALSARSPHQGFYVKRSRPTGYTREEYSYLVMKCDLALLLYKIKDHSVAAHRRQLIRVLCHDRLNLLTTPAKAMVLHALQKIKLSSDRPTMERAVFDILTSCRGHDLTELKAIMDSKGNYHSLHKLVYYDIKTTTTRKLIADHMLEEARRILGDGRRRSFDHFEITRSKSLPIDSTLLMPPSSTPPLAGQDPYVFSDPTVPQSRLLIQARTKIISDYDDTIECSGGLYPAGCDRRYDRHVCYPGVGAFYREIDLCGSGDVVSALVARGWPAEGEDGGITRLGNLAVISARPRGFAEHSSYSKFAALQKKGLLHCTPTLLPGSLIGGKEFVLRDRLEPLAENKFSNFKEYVTLYPEFDYVFVGDNGQADVRAVAMMMQMAYIKFRAAFIHVVQPLEETFGLPSDLSKFCFFTNYVQAGVYAYENKLMSAASLARVVIDTVDRFEAVKQIKVTGDPIGLSGGTISSAASDHSPRAESVMSVNTDVATSVSKTEQEKTENLRLEINSDIERAVILLKQDVVIGEAELGWSHEMVSTVRDLLLEIRPIDAPRYLVQNARVVTKYAQGEVEGFAADIGMYTVRISGKGGKPLKSGARVFTYYTQVKEDDQASGKWPRLPSLGIFSRRMSHSEYGSPTGRESPRSSVGKVTSS
jgi:hypothetical protein